MMKFAAIAGVSIGAIGTALALYQWMEKPKREYAIASGANGTVWRLDTATGQLSMCYVYSANSEPFCGPPGPLGGEALHKRAQEIMSGLVAKPAAEPK